MAEFFYGQGLDMEVKKTSDAPVRDKVDSINGPNAPE